MALVLTALTAGSLAAQVGMEPQAKTASAVLVNPDGDRIGTAELIETPNYGVLIRVDVGPLEPGAHGFHIHETGQCTLPDFSSAGGHYGPRGRSHGIMHPHGKHAGDLANLFVPESGRVIAERLAQDVTLVEGATGTLFDEDGSALVIHAEEDDYRSQPSGAAGPRVACGVIR